MASIYKREKDGPYYIAYSIRPHVRKIVTGCYDLRATQAIGRKLEDEARQIRRGTIDRRAENLVASERGPLQAKDADDHAACGHLDAFAAALRGKGGTENHVLRTVRMIGAMLDACAITQAVNLDAGKLAAHVAELKRGGLSARTINARLTALKSFSRWMFRTERMRTDPMMQVNKLNAKADRRHVRRALADDELSRLLKTAQAGPALSWHKGNGKDAGEYQLATLTLSGADRAMLYRLAAETGLRAGELASLTPASFALADLSAATVTVSAAYSKHRRDDVVPMRRDLAQVVAGFVKGRPADAPLFAMPERTADMMQADLLAARDGWLQESATAQECYERFGTSFLLPCDSSGHVADFHALRHTFITRLARSGVAPAVAKSLARHSTITLTMDHYTHTLIGDERAALDRLPTMTPATPETQSAKATGTYAVDATPPARFPVAPEIARSALQTRKGANTRDDWRPPTGAARRAETPANTGNCEHLRLSSITSGPLAQRIEQGTHNHIVDSSKASNDSILAVSPAASVAPEIARTCEDPPTPANEIAPDLAQVVAAWPALPDALKAGIVAMVAAAGGAKK